MWSLHKLFAASRLEGEFFAVVHEGGVLHDKNHKSDFPVISANILLAKSSYWCLSYSEMGIIKKYDLSGVRGHTVTFLNHTWK